MKILWIVNTIFPYPSQQLGMKKNPFGGWLIGLANKCIQEENIELAIATVYSGSDFKEFKDEKITYYLIPGAPAIKYNKKIEEYWKKVNKEFKPDIVHIHGSEFTHGLGYVNSCQNTRVILEIQGMVSVYAKVYYANLPISEIIKNITLRDIVRFDTIIQARKKFIKRGNFEIALINKVNNIIGRTTWDYANVKAINPSTKYYKLNETLRKAFYNNIWNYDKIEKHSIFCSQASYPIKGLHYMLDAMYILKQKYPDVKLYIAGNDIIHKKSKTSGYGKIILNKIKKYNIENNVIFTGILNENEMVERLLKTNVFALPSSIENSSNSLGEAMLLGMPCVASNSGGTMDILKHKEEGLLYPYTEPAVLAHYIEQLFENKELAEEYGKKARTTALNRHNPETNTKNVIEIYEKILKEEK